MREPVLAAAILAAISLSTPALAYDLKVHGIVTDYVSGSVLTNATLKVYKNGVKEHTEATGLLGMYAYTLDNNALYVLRFTAPGCQTKCFTIDTHGLAWEGDNKTKDLFVEMTLFRRIEEMDLGFFDLPMGQAHFQPATGLVSWDDAYDERIRTEVQKLMAEYERITAPAYDATSSVQRAPTIRRKHNGAVR